MAGVPEFVGTGFVLRLLSERGFCLAGARSRMDMNIKKGS